jgi:hypothetical protein
MLDTALVDYIVPTTANSYACCAGSYERFCDLRGLQPYPADQVQVSAWIIRLMTSVQPTSLGPYLAAVRFTHINQGFPWLLEGNECVRRVLRYVKRRFPCGGKAVKIAISLSVLRRILPLLPGWPNLTSMSHADLLFACASVIGSCGFLRGGEFLYTPRQARPILRFHHVAVRVIKGTPSVVVSVPQAKAEWWRVSTDVPIFGLPDQSDPFSPVMLWQALCTRSKHVNRDGGSSSHALPAFHNADGSPLRKDAMTARTLGLLQQANIGLVDARGSPTTVKASSWRAGGVRSAVDAGISEQMMMELGRWKSSAWTSYLTHSSLDLRGASWAMWRAADSAPHFPDLWVGGEVAPGPHMALVDAAVADDVRRRTDARTTVAPAAAPSAQQAEQAVRAAAMFVALQQQSLQRS